MLENIIKANSNYKIIAKNTIICILSTILLAITSQISIPLPGGVPMTLQTFSLVLIGYTLSQKCGIETILIYLISGAVGISVFAGGNFGISTIFGITGGFLIGFILLVWFCNKAKCCKRIAQKNLLSGIGLMFCHFIGVLQYSFLTGVTLTQAFLLVSLPFILKDSFSVVLAFIISEQIDFIKSRHVI